MKYTIATLEVKETSTGKKKANVELTTPDGVSIKNVSIWEDFPNFQSLTFGAEVEGDLVPAKDPKWGPTLYPARQQSAPRSTGGSMRGVAAAQERKSEYIKEAQERKEESIAFFNATNAAIQIVTGGSEPLSLEEKKDNIIWWREFFLSEWRKYDAKPEQDKHIPF